MYFYEWHEADRPENFCVPTFDCGEDLECLPGDAKNDIIECKKNICTNSCNDEEVCKVWRPTGFSLSTWEVTSWAYDPCPARKNDQPSGNSLDLVTEKLCPDG